MQLQSQELEIDHLGYLQDEKYKFSVVESSIVISDKYKFAEMTELKFDSSCISIIEFDVSDCR